MLRERRPSRPAPPLAGLRRVVLSLLVTASLIAANRVDAGGLRGDVNCDGQVDQGDFDALVADLFGADSTCAQRDVNGDGALSAADLVALVELLPAPTPTDTPTPPSATPSTPTRTASTPTSTG